MFGNVTNSYSNSIFYELCTIILVVYDIVNAHRLHLLEFNVAAVEAGKLAELQTLLPDKNVYS